MVIVPTLDRERKLWREGLLRVAGVDEVGIGPLAGPVVAAAYVVPPNCRRIAGVRDSKTLSAGQRERLYGMIVRRAAAVGVGAASVTEIDRLNVLVASRLAMRRALARVGACDHILVDGRDIKEWHSVPHTAIVDGDATSYAIACASIVAKVTRDRLMKRLARLHPDYGWDHNVGYSTAEHLAAIDSHGPTRHHRKSFMPFRERQLVLDLGHTAETEIGDAFASPTWPVVEL